MRKDLPPELTMARLLSGEAPGDLTIGECRAFTKTMPELRGLAELSRTGVARVRFLWTVDDNDVPDDMRLSDFRDLARAKLTHIVVDDGTGGVGARAPEHV